MPYISCDEAFCEEKEYTGHDCWSDHWVHAPLPENAKMKEPRRDFFYIHDTKYPTTVAYDINWDESEHGDIKVTYATAHCSVDKDNFNKKLGRLIASGRLNKRPMHLSIQTKLDYSGDMWHIIRHAIKNQVLYTKIRELHERHALR